MDLEGFVDAVTGHTRALLPVQGHHKQVGANQNQKSEKKKSFWKKGGFEYRDRKKITDISC